MLSYPSGMAVSSRALNLLSAAIRRLRREMGSRWRILDSGRQALLVLAHLRKGETYADLACGFGIGIRTVYRYLREGIDLLAAMAPTLEQAIEVAQGKAFVILDGSLLRIDRVMMASKRDRPFYSGKWKAHGVNVQVITDPAGRLIWVSPALPGSVHDIKAARHHEILAELAKAKVMAFADTAYQGSPENVRTPLRSRRQDPATRKMKPLSAGQKAANTAHARIRAIGERANSQLKNWRVLRKIRSSPHHATSLVNAIQTLILAG
ncbi:transposase [Kineosporia sp. J2-2]|uniref:Transposase n=1 Tax=Kineosporia corallincola TaxID=2835133 RepID=A0ABS5TTS5_9ACTN|nr:transposase family protein [Kineosporia corallincola]MBT0774144.1 transposase [Kineosporia corallincola]